MWKWLALRHACLTSLQAAPHNRKKTSKLRLFDKGLCMTRPIYVIGHKNSDMDSVASAYAYARLLQLQGESEVQAARNGKLKPEVRFVLDRFQVEPPEAIDDLYLQVRDVMK